MAHSNSGDYFTRRAGFVLEDRSFLDENAARTYCVEKWGMSEREAEKYLYRLRNEFKARIKTATARTIEGGN